jgi:VanZ family protein
VTFSGAWPRALAPLALMALIFYLSAQPSVGPELPAWTRVVAHLSEYFVLTSLWLWALAPALGTRTIPAAAGVSFLYAISDEYHQGFVEGRDSDPLDVLIDTTGIVAACWLAYARGSASTRATHSARRG